MKFTYTKYKLNNQLLYNSIDNAEIIRYDDKFEIMLRPFANFSGKYIIIEILNNNHKTISFKTVKIGFSESLPIDINLINPSNFFYIEIDKKTSKFIISNYNNSEKIILKSELLHKKIYENFYPIIIDEVELHKDFLLYNNEKEEYKELTAIVFNHNIDSINGVTSKEEITFGCYFYESDDQLFNTDDENTILREIILIYDANMFLKDKDKKEKILFIYNFLTNITFESRLSKYYYFLKRDGFFLLSGIKFFNNGDIYENGVYQGNIRQAFKENKLIHGERFGTYKSSYDNPYLFAIIKGRKFLGFVEDRFEFYNQFNKDIFDILVENCIKHGKMINDL